MDNRISVSAAIWQWILQSISLSSIKEDLRERLINWTSGEKSPTFNQLEDFSKAVHIPLGYFFLQTPPVETCPVLEYRTVNSTPLNNPSRNLLDTVRHMENIQEWMRDYLISMSTQPMGFVGSLNKEDTIHSSANSVREALELSENWYITSENANVSFKNLCFAMSNLGVLVMQNGVFGSNPHRPLDLDEFRAFTLLDEFAPLIFINAKDSRGGKLFSLLHEFVHIGIGEGSLLNTDEWGFVSTLETFCNRVVAEILVPQTHFNTAWEEQNGDVESKVGRLATQFRCSQSVIVRQALNMGLITKDGYAKLQQKAKMFVKQSKKSKGGDYWATLLTRADHRFLKALECSVNEGSTLYTEALRLTNTNLSTFEAMLGKVKAKGDLA